MRARTGKKELANRVPALRWVFLGGLALIAAGYWNLQVIHGEEYRERAFRNSLRREALPAQRGQIADREGRILAETVPVYELWWDPAHSRDVEETLAFVDGLLRGEVDRTAERWRPQPGRRLVAEDLGLDQVARVEARWSEYPDLRIEVGPRRLYRQGANAGHLTGYLGDPTQKDLSERPDLRGTDRIGRTGLERIYDGSLRGEPGRREVVVDSRGRPREEQSRLSPRIGERLNLAVDLELQQLARDLLAERVGAVVALDPRDGEVLALVSTPSYDPNVFSRRLNAEAWKALITAPHNPLQNRPVQSAYSPGSVFKIVTAAALLGEAIVNPAATEYCAGSTVMYGRRTRCWKRGGHGWVNLRTAIRESCDVYFYHQAPKLDIDVLADYARRFGLGEPTGIDLPGEAAGLVPSREWKRKARSEPWYPGETVSAVIGQGPVLVTAMQMARMMAVVANGGSLVEPHLVSVVAGQRKQSDINPRHLDLIGNALAEVVADGTGRSARSEVVQIAGKTATVQVVEQVTWTTNEELPVEHRDHSWFASYAPVEDPELVVVAFVEHGGAGSRSAAPIARAIHERHFGG